MKIKLILFLTLFMAITIFSSAQVKVDVEKKVNNQANSRANRHTDKAIDNAFNKLEDGIGGLFNKNRKKKNKKKGESQQESQTQQNNSAEQTTEEVEETKPAEPQVKWNKFDFVPGDEVIFEDGPSADEENGEFPSRWDLYQGGAEIAEVDGEYVIMFITDVGNMYSKGIIPYLKDRDKDYLPEVFTIEFDAYFPPNVSNNRYYLSFYDRKNHDRSETPQIEFNVNSVEAGDSESTYKGKSRGNSDEVGGWRHFSIAYTKGKLKVYLEDQRMINIPHAEGNPTGVTLAGAFENSFTKNFRIAKGGVKYYDKVLSDGKIIVNGIRFDVNKATIKPESNGAINNIFKLMQKQPELNFSVEGHTDSDGDETINMELSKARGKAVMERLISLGIAANRIKSTGWGESKALADNGTAEGKANNRRVEFVKF